MVSRPLPIFLKFISWILHFGGGISTNFLKNHKSKKFQNFFPPLLGILKIERKNETVKRAIYHKIVQLENLFTKIVTNTLNFNSLGETCQLILTKVGCLS